MLSSITGQTKGSHQFAGVQSSSPASWRSPSSTNQPASGSASDHKPPPPFDSVMAKFLQVHGIARGTGSMLSSGISDDAQFVSASGAPTLPNLQSLLSILSNRGASSTAEDGAGASSASTVATAVDDLNAMLTKGVRAVANDIKPNATTTVSPSTASGNTAASGGSAAQTSLPPWAAGWFNVGASTEAATTGWTDPFGQQNGTPLNQQHAQAAAAYGATGGASRTRSVTNVTA